MNHSPNVLATFRAEANDKLAAVDEILMSFESDAFGSNEMSQVDGIRTAFRHIHGLKGAAGLLGFPKLVNVLHGMETVLGRMRDDGLTGGSRLLDILLQATEISRRLVLDSDSVSNARIAGLESSLQSLTLAESMPLTVSRTHPTGPDEELSGRSLLIVDDSALSRKIIRDAAERAQWHVVAEAENGSDAVDLFRRHHPRLVTLDLVMPKMAGLDALTVILEEEPNATVIIVSALDQKEIYREAFRLGATDFLIKPVDPQRLRAMLHRVDATTKEPSVPARP